VRGRVSISGTRTHTSANPGVLDHKTVNSNTSRGRQKRNHDIGAAGTSPDPLPDGTSASGVEADQIAGRAAATGASPVPLPPSSPPARPASSPPAAVPVSAPPLPVVAAASGRPRRASSAGVARLVQSMIESRDDADEVAGDESDSSFEVDQDVDSTDEEEGEGTDDDVDEPIGGSRAGRSGGASVLVEMTFEELQNLLVDLERADGILGHNLLGNRSGTLHREVERTRDHIFQLVLGVVRCAGQNGDGSFVVDEEAEVQEELEEPGEDTDTNGKDPARPLSRYRVADLLTERLLVVVEALVDLQRVAQRHHDPETAKVQVKEEAQRQIGAWRRHAAELEQRSRMKAVERTAQMESCANAESVLEAVTSFVVRTLESPGATAARAHSNDSVGFVLHLWWSMLASAAGSIAAG
jgi:hypothetical protein